MHLFCLSAIAAVSGCNHRTAGPALQQLNVALTADGITWHSVRLAQSGGYAAQEGISLNISEVAGMSKGMVALLGGSADIIAGTLTQAIQVAAEGGDVLCFFSLHSRPATTLAVAPAMAEKIRAIGDLKGRTVGVTSPGSATHQLVNFLLSAHGLSPADIAAVSVGAGSSSIMALEHGKVDAAVLVGSGITLFEKRYPKVRPLADSRTEEGTRQIFGITRFQSSSMIARADWLRSKPDTARRFVRAVRKAMYWIGSHSPEEVRSTIPETLRMPDVDVDLQAIRQSQQTLTPDGLMPPDVPEVALKLVALSSEKVRSARIDLSKTYTNDFCGK